MITIKNWIVQQFYRLTGYQLTWFLTLGAIISLFILWKKNEIFICYLVVFFFFLSAVLIPFIGRLIYTIFSTISYPIGLVLSTAALLITYICIITPLRLFKKPFTSEWISSTATIDPTLEYE